MPNLFRSQVLEPILDFLRQLGSAVILAGCNDDLTIFDIVLDEVNEVF